MADFYVVADGGSEDLVEPVAKAIESAGATAERGSEHRNHEAIRNSGKVKPPTKLVFIVNGGLAGQTYGSFALDFQEGMCFTIFAFAAWDNPTNSTLKESALKTEKLVSEHDSGSFATSGIAADFAGHTTCSYQAKYPNVFAFISDEKSAESMGQRIAKGDYTCGHGDSSANENEEEEEDWGDRDNFTPHKGKIMEIRPYKQFSSISFDKSYDSPTGTGNVEILYNAKDYKTIYKGVAMKLKLRRSCDPEWSATGLEEPDYEEHEKFFKEHIPTDELLKELGLPNYRKRDTLTSTTTSDTSSTDGNDTNSSDGNNQSTNTQNT